MKANLYPHLGNALLPALLRAGRHRQPISSSRWQLRADSSSGSAIDLDEHGRHRRQRRGRAVSSGRRATAKVLTPVELVEGHAARSTDGKARDGHRRGLRRGESLGLALDRAKTCREPTRRLLLGHFVSEELADRPRSPLRARRRGRARGGVPRRAGRRRGARQAMAQSPAARAEDRRARARPVCRHADRCTASITRCRCFSRRSPGFSVACPAIASIPKMRALALREARPGYAEYYFLFPLFLSITLLTSGGLLRRDEAVSFATGIDDARARRTSRSAQFLGSDRSLRDPRQQHRRRLRVARAAAVSTCRRLHLLRDGADRRLRARRLLDAHRLRAVGRSRTRSSSVTSTRTTRPSSGSRR